MNQYSFTRGALALCGVALLAGAASAQQTQVESDSILLQPTNWDETISVPKFDVADATLLSVEFELVGSAEGSASIENRDAQPATITTSFSATVTLTRPDMSVLAVTLPVANFVDDLDAFDGTIDFMGASGTQHLNIMASDSDTVLTTDPVDLALFSGPGTIDLPCDAVGSSTASGSGNLTTAFNTSAEAQVTVTYSYIVDCNGNQVDDSQDILNGDSPDANGNNVPDECEPEIDRYCIGDGEADDDSIVCPCSNNNADNLGGCNNLLGQSAILSATGNPSVSNDTLVLEVTGVPLRSPGWYFLSTSSAPAGVVLGNGVACLVNPQQLVKLPPLSGNGTLPEAGDPDPLSVTYSIAPGTTTHWQFWYRDRLGNCNGGANASNALRVVWGL